MDVKSLFLNGVISEEVYVKQPPGFEDITNPDHVFRLKKSLYGLKQAPGAWYERLSNFLVNNGFEKGQVDNTLFRKTLKKDILIIQIYVDDIIFGSTNATLCKNFSKLMHDEFEMSMMGELKFFLGIQINQTKKGTFIHQSKYIKYLLMKYNLEDCKPMNTSMHPTSSLGKDDSEGKVDQKLFRSMIGSLLYLTASRPDILFSVCLCARFQSDPTRTGTFSSIPRGYLTERSANWMDILVGHKSPNLSLSHMDMGIKLILAPKSHRALSIMYGPITQGMEKLPGFCSLEGILF
ncbi:hypothetical protein QL285_070217 [Trifolium repens]|nr:hypothetical protein QL285_070217 [Trifolium repens]